MSSMLWLPSSGSAPVSVTPDTGDWTLHDSGVRRELLFTDVGASAITAEAYSPDVVDHLVAGSALHSQYVSKLLPAQPYPSQMIRLVILCAETYTFTNMFLRWKLYVVDAAGSSALGVLVPYRTDDTEFATTVTGRRGFIVASRGLLVAASHRLVLEIGGSGTPTESGNTDDGHNTQMQVGEFFSSWQGFPSGGDTDPAAPYLLFNMGVRE